MWHPVADVQSEFDDMKVVEVCATDAVEVRANIVSAAVAELLPLFIQCLAEIGSVVGRRVGCGVPALTSSRCRSRHFSKDACYKIMNLNALRRRSVS